MLEMTRSVEQMSFNYDGMEDWSDNENDEDEIN